MATRPLLTVEIRLEPDIVLARQRARQIAALLGFAHLDQMRIATATSEIARNAYQYAGGGRVEFQVDFGPPVGVAIEIRERGPGIRDLEAILEGRHVSNSGMGVGILGARRLMDRFEIETREPGGSCVTMAKYLPARSAAITPPDLAGLAAALARDVPRGVIEEVQAQNQELLRALQELKERQAEIAQIHSRELVETNRGVVALYAELDESARALKRLSDLKSRFLSEMSHELRTPLSSIRSLSGFLLDRGDGDLTAEQEKQVILIRKAAEELMGLVDDLLDLARVEAGKAVVRASWFDLQAVFDGLQATIRPTIERTTVSLEFDVGGAGARLYSDEGKLTQVVRNFLSNAVKFTEAGEIRVTARAEPGDRLRIAVADTGIGIAAGDLPRVFEEYGQVENPLQSRTKGTGLGLPLARKLAEVLGGSVSVQSQPGFGSTFAVTIPRVYRPAEDRTMAEPVASAPPRGDTGSGDPRLPARVLIVDDREDSRYAIRSTLLRLGALVVVEAASGAEAIGLARSGRHDLVILDLGLPDMTGFQVLDRLEAEPGCRESTVIIHTSRALDEREFGLLRGRVAAVLDKNALGRQDAAAVLRDCLTRLDSRGARWTGGEPMR
ncbi:MAG: ATP-binding response regulator [Isosphaeraceae bacterium]